MRRFTVYRTPDGDFLTFKQIQEYYKIGVSKIYKHFNDSVGWEILKKEGVTAYKNEDKGVYSLTLGAMAEELGVSKSFLSYRTRDGKQGYKKVQVKDLSELSHLRRIDG